jgi:hypothetical protein
MEKSEILAVVKSQVKDETSRYLRLPNLIDFYIHEKCLYVTIKEQGVIKNMQENASAFESWALIIRAAFESVGIFVRIRIDGEKLDELPNRDKNHYNYIRQNEKCLFTKRKVHKTFKYENSDLQTRSLFF